MKISKGIGLEQIAATVANDWLEQNFMVEEDTITSAIAHTLSEVVSSEGREPESLWADRIARHAKKILVESGIAYKEPFTAACIVLSLVARLVCEKADGIGIAMELFGRAADCDPDYYDRHQQRIAEISIDEDNLNEILEECKELNKLKIVEEKAPRADITNFYQQTFQAGSNPQLANGSTINVNERG